MANLKLHGEILLGLKVYMYIVKPTVKNETKINLGDDGPILPFFHNREIFIEEYELVL